MKKELLSILIVLFVVTSTFGNNNFLNVNGTIKFDGDPISEASIKVVSTNLSVTTISSDIKGKFTVNLPTNKSYKLIISKNGFHSQQILFTTDINSGEEGVWKYRFIVDLFPSLSDMSNNLFNKPIAHVMYNQEIDEFENNINSDKILNLHSLLSQYTKTIEQESKNCIISADSAFVLENYNLALIIYQKASSLNQYDNYADTQIDMIGRIITQDKRIDLKYNNNIEVADLLYDAKEYDKAKKYYSKAYKLKASDYPQKQLSKIKNIVPLGEVLSAK